MLISDFRSNITNSLIAQGVPAPTAAKTAASAAQLQGGSGGVASIPQFIRADFASATQSVLTGMGIIMALAAVVAILGLRRGVQRETVAEATAEPTSAGSGQRLFD